MHRPTALCLTAAALLVAGCGTKSTPARVQASGGATPKIDAARTYAWVLDPATDRSRDDLNNNAQFLPVIQAEIEEALQEKGFAKVTPTQSPGFEIAFATAIRDTEATVADERYFGGQTFAGVPVSYTIVGSPGEVEGAETATIVVDARDPRSGDVLWRGAAGGAVDRELDPEARQAKIAQIIERLLTTFPDSQAGARP